MHLLVPMSGQGARFARAGYTVPKPLIDVGGEPMIARVLAMYPSHWPAHFVVADNHHDTELPAVLGAIRPDAALYTVPRHSEGPAVAIEAALPGIPADAPVLVSYCDFGMVWDAEAFARMARDSGCDAALVTYRGFQPHYFGGTPYAYARLSGERVIEVREKGHFTAQREDEHASAGAYYFRNKHVLADALAAQRAKALRVNGELYTSLTVQALLVSQPDAYVRVFEADAFFQWGTPADVEAYLYWRAAYRAQLQAARSGADPIAAHYHVAQTLMPMAGGGSRFAGLSPTPKPLIDLDGAPMFACAQASLPRPTRTQAFVALHRDEAAVAHAAAALPGPPARVTVLPTTPSGQALSTRAGLAALEPDAEVLVSACDHGIVLPPTRWRSFHADPRCDAAIFTVTGYPGASRHPHSFAYVQPEAADPHQAFPKVARVSVKVPLSEQPQRDAVLVGTFWCRSAALLQEGIDALIAADRRVNGELYLDSVLALWLEQGLTVRMVPLAGYLNWGAPDALNETQYWRRALTGLAAAPRRGLHAHTNPHPGTVANKTPKMAL